jgi:hypothetical protein
MKTFNSVFMLLFSVSAVLGDNIRVEPKGKPKRNKMGQISEAEIRQDLSDWGAGLVVISQVAVTDRTTVALLLMYY